MWAVKAAKNIKLIVKEIQLNAYEASHVTHAQSQILKCKPANPHSQPERGSELKKQIYVHTSATLVVNLQSYFSCVEKVFRYIVKL